VGHTKTFDGLTILILVCGRGEVSVDGAEVMQGKDKLRRGTATGPVVGVEMDEFVSLKHDENGLVQIKQGLGGANNEEMLLVLVADKARCNKRRVLHGERKVKRGNGIKKRR
jgi:hypothetical protein